MSAGAAAVAEGSVVVAPARAGVLALLERELRAAENTGEVRQAARLRARIALLSGGSREMREFT